VQRFETAFQAAVHGNIGKFAVLFDERQLAKIHACTGPAFFALAVGLLVATSRGWRELKARVGHSGAIAMQTTASLAALLAYLQLVLGAQMRHVAPSAAPGVFRVYVVFHLALAGLLVFLTPC
jgi:cytochrome c oxidase assembly protein subunit 15